MKQQKKRHFKEDIYRTFVVYALIPILLVAIIIFGSVYAIWNRTIITQVEEKNILIQQKLQTVVTSFINKTYELANDKLFYQMLIDDRYKHMAYEKLYHFSNSIPEKADFYILNERLELIAGSTNQVPAFIPQGKSVSWGIINRMKAYPSQVILECSKTYKDNLSRSQLLIGKAVVENEKVKGYLLFVLYGDEFVKTSENIAIQMIVTDQYDNVFIETTQCFKNVQDKIRSEFKKENNYIKIDGNKYYKKKSSIIFNKLNIYTFTEVGSYQRVFIWGSICFLILIGMLSVTMLVAAKKITKEKTKIIDKIVEAFQKVQKGNLDEELYIKSYDEFEVIGKSYNLMLLSIRKLIDINEEKIKQASLAQIKQLESQFNPHFLYNTLEHIRYMAKLNPDAASKMIVSLSTLLRYSINNGILDVMVKEDVEYTKCYLLIQKYRFNERFQYTIYIEREAEDCVVPKLILQPIIENAIKYGFGDKDELTVKVKASFLADDLVIVIYDDGVGMQPEVLKELQDILKQDTNPSRHIGLYNVHRRIQLMYGKEYGLDLKSEINVGTVVKITLPINKREA